MSAKQSVTLNDVAREAEVSVATVSRVLNRKSKVDAQTRDKVLRAATILNYDVSAFTQKAMPLPATLKKEMRVELLLCPMLEQKDLLQLDFMSEILRGIQNYFNRHRNVVMTISTLETEEHHEDKLLLRERLAAAAGLIIMGSPNDELISFLQHNAIRYVMLPNDLPHIAVNSVCSDDFAGGFRAAEYLIEKGFDKIGFLCGSSHARSHAMRKYGALAAVADHLGMDAFESRTSATSNNADIEDCFRHWLDSGTCPLALITSHSNAAEVVCSVLESRGLQCPEDLSIITFDSEVKFRSGLKISSFCTFPHELGIKAAQQIYQTVVLPHHKDKVCKTLVPLEFHEGNSVIRALAK